MKNTLIKSAIFAPARKSGSLALSVLRAYSSAWLERFPDKEEVSGSSPLRPTLLTRSAKNKYGDLAQLVEHLLCKQGVRGSIPLVST